MPAIAATESLAGTRRNEAAIVRLLVIFLGEYGFSPKIADQVK
jgi:hypothetical protein